MLAGWVRRHRPFSFALLCVHQRAGAALMKKKKKKNATFYGPLHRKAATRTAGSRAALPFFGGGLRRHANGGRHVLVFSSPAWPGGCKGERSGRLPSLPALAPAKKKRTKNVLRYRHTNTHRGPITPSRRRRHPAASTVSRNCAASLGASVPTGRNRDRMVAVVVVVVPHVTSRRVACACARMT